MGLSEAPKGGPVELRLEVDPGVYEKIGKLAEKLNTNVANIVLQVLSVLADYSNDIVGLGELLAVSGDKRAVSTLEELIYYGVESWRSIVNPLLGYLGAVGCYELESIDFEPLEPLLEVEMVALEGCRYKVDRFTLTWSPKGVSLEAYYYLERGVRPSPKASIAYEWSFLPDENAIVVSITAPSIAQIPQLEAIDRELGKLGV
jgi:hypothetical protein